MMTNAPITSPSNAQAEYWNSPAARPWAEQHERQDRALAKLTTVALDLAAPEPGAHVLDIGCGSGTTVLALAARVGPRGHVLGADISEHSVAQARARIAAAGLQHAEVILADVAAHPFIAGSFDLAFSQLGVMFFNDPTAAFANVHRAMKPAGRLPYFARPARTRGPARPSQPCVTSCRLCPGPRQPSQARSHGPIQPAWSGYSRAPGFVRLH
jgi:SAM-dependent methyltransferase